MRHFILTPPVLSGQSGIIGCIARTVKSIFCDVIPLKLMGMLRFVWTVDTQIITGGADMKKKYYIVIILLLCGILIALGIKSSSFKFPKAVKAEIEEAWLFAYEREINLDYREYYGTYHGAVFFFCEGMTDGVWQISVAGKEFKWPGGASIMVYKDGLIYSLEKAYEDGLLTERNIKSISRRHEWNKIKHGYGDF